MKRFLAIAMIAAMSTATFASCGSSDTTTSSESASSTESTATSTESTASAETTSSDTPLVVAYDTFNQKFNPFYTTVQYDSDVVDMVIESLFGTDRVGAIVYNGIEGETRSYNGTDYTYYGLSDITVDQGEDTTTYTFKLREGVLFSDGVELTADDVIFSLYVYLDPSYTGSTTLYSEDIVGLNNYRTQTSDEVYEKYTTMYEYFDANGDAGEYGDELFADYESNLKDVWTDDLAALVDEVYDSYAGSYASTIGADEVSDDQKVAFTIALWGFGEYDEESGVLTAADGTAFDLANGENPVIDDLYNAAVATYGDAASYDDGEDRSVASDAESAFILTYGSQDESMGGEGVPNIEGIKKVDDYTVSITTNGYSCTTIYKLAIRVSPMHYYGDESKYDYDNNQFGFDFGDLSSIESNLNPMGSGPYAYDGYENKTVYFSANENYWKGAPKTKSMQWKETAEADKIAALGTGTADLANPSGSVAKLEEIASYNSNGETTGDVLETVSYDNNGYGYIGLSALNMKVGTSEDDINSEESVALRKGFATVLAAYRDLACDSYYGEAAKVIQYSISSCSWAAPQATDSDYEIAYSTDVDGNPIYTADMTDDEKYAAALEASIGFFKKAGYTWDEASGKFTAAPEGAKMSYEVIIPGGGQGEHPAYMLLEKARDALDSIGITLVINDPSDSNVLWNALDANTEEMWTAAWSSSVDPDMYQTWHSKNVVGASGSTGSNHAYLIDSELDSLIMDARTSADQTYRKAVYKQCLDIIKDWAVEVPNYQRQNIYIFSPERINMDTVTPDITTYWSWMNDIELLEMN
jgi:peptide/nickel transport system substrate-binding protein